jgi:hypothetical protein
VKPFVPILRAGLAALAFSPLAQAAPPEIFSQLALHPSDPNRIVLAYAQGGQGLLFSSDGGRSFALRCGSAVSTSFTRSRLPLMVTADGSTLLGTFAGLVRGGIDGCGFGDDPDFVGLQVADFAPHPSDGALSFLITANATDGRATGLVRREPDGTFTELGRADAARAADAGAADADVSMNRLGIAARADGGLRFYASALVADGDEYRPVVRYSDDEGASWVSHDVLDAEGARVLLIGVDPTDPERIAIALQRDGAPDTVLFSADGGASFERRLEIFELGASSVAPDGRLFVGDAGGDSEYSQPGGLYRFDGFAAAPQKLATFPVRCLGFRALDGALFACKRSEFGSVDPASGAFTMLASFATIGAFVSCGGEDLAPVCKTQLCDNWCGVLHYANAPLCDAYDEVSPLCGPAARGYGEAGPSGGASGADSILPGDPAATDPSVAPPAAPATSIPAAATSSDSSCRIGSPSAHRTARAASSGLALAAMTGFFPALALWLRRRGAPARACNLHCLRRH